HGIFACLSAVGSAAAQPFGYRVCFMPQKWKPELRAELLLKFSAKSIYRPKTSAFIRKRHFGLCPVAGLPLWVVISMRVTAAEIFPSVTIPAGTGTARSVRDTKRKSGSRSANRIYSRAVIIIWFLRFLKN